MSVTNIKVAARSYQDASFKNSPNFKKCLDNLKFLNLAENQFVGQVPTELALLTKLSTWFTFCVGSCACTTSIIVSRLAFVARPILRQC